MRTGEDPAVFSFGEVVAEKVDLDGRAFLL